MTTNNQQVNTQSNTLKTPPSNKADINKKTDSSGDKSSHGSGCGCGH